MNSNSNSYIFIYSVVMVVIVAAILSIAATVLKPMQQQNIRNEKMSSILASANIESTAENAEELYNKYIVQELVVNANGDIVGTYENGKLDGNVRAFNVKIKTEQFKQKNDMDFVSPLYVCKNDGHTFYIIPMLGKGLWGPVWGNIALKEDMNTVVGVIFDHKGETPGLGAEISTSDFEMQFVNKTIFDNNGEFISIKVQKGGVATLPASMENHAVDAISGGTITSDAVSEMMKDCLNNYVPYIKNQK